jgi:hypothetical protein
MDVGVVGDVVVNLDGDLERGRLRPGRRRRRVNVVDRADVHDDVSVNAIASDRNHWRGRA